MNQVARAEILTGLQADILRLQGFKSVHGGIADVGLELMRDAFPNGSFPLGAVHEFLHSTAENSTATAGFIATVAGSLMKQNGTALWISSSRTLFPPALKSFGIDPDRIVFIDLQKEKHVLWAMEEALKCSSLAAVVGEMNQINFTASRRLQLAVEQSQVTGFVIGYCSNSQKANVTACVSRWQITSLPSEVIEDVPGIGFPKWRIELLKIRNGRPGTWDVQWKNGRFFPIYKAPHIFKEQDRKAG